MIGGPDKIDCFCAFSATLQRATVGGGSFSVGPSVGRAARAGSVAPARLEVRSVELLKRRFSRIVLMLATLVGLVSAVAADVRWK